VSQVSFGFKGTTSINDKSHGNNKSEAAKGKGKGADDDRAAAGVGE
jgi:hypothetical protein